MTGFGKATTILPNKKITIEIKSLNSKGIEINTRMPSSYREKDLEIRKLLSEHLLRGKIDFGMYIVNTGTDEAIKINTPMVRKYLTELKTLDESGKENLLQIAMQLPEAISASREEINLQEWEHILQTINMALFEIKQFRNQEGAALKNDFEQRITNIKKSLTEIQTLDPGRKSEIVLKLRKAIDDLKINVDENRFEQELIYYLEKLDINEEIVRLNNHLSYFIQDLNHTESNGRKMNFIAQEMGREINTIGSKANHAPMQKLVIEMKDELEKIKEQSLNVL